MINRTLNVRAPKGLQNISVVKLERAGRSIYQIKQKNIILWSGSSNNALDAFCEILLKADLQTKQDLQDVQDSCTAELNELSLRLKILEEQVAALEESSLHFEEIE